jgi:hypothetical protein
MRITNSSTYSQQATFGRVSLLRTGTHRAISELVPSVRFIYPLITKQFGHKKGKNSQLEQRRLLRGKSDAHNFLVVERDTPYRLASTGRVIQL